MIHVKRIRLFRWQASVPGLLNPRYGFTYKHARSRIEADLLYEWRTGKVRRGQRKVES